MDGTQTQINPNGNRVVKKTDGSSITYMVSGEEVHEDASGRRKQLNPDGSVVVSEPTRTPTQPVQKAPQNAAPSVTASQVDPKALFAQHLEDAQNAGSEILSQVQKRTSRKVVFKDGSKLLLTKEGVMLHKYSDGRKMQCTPDGKRTTVCSGT